MAQELTGTVKLYKEDKGFGFIEIGHGQKDVFFHITELRKSGLDAPAVGDKLTFELGRHQGKEMATNIRKAA